MRAEGTLTAIEKASIEAHKRLTDKQVGLSFFEIFKAGYEQAEKDLMEKTVEGNMELNHIVVSYSDLARVFPNGKDGDKVKVVIIKD